jgi:hypothetical protein
MTQIKYCNRCFLILIISFSEYAEMEKKLAEAEKKIAEAEEKSRREAEERKILKAQIDLVTGFMSSNPRWNEYVSQAGSQHVDGSGSGVGGSGSAGGSGSRRGDEDDSGDDEGPTDDHE